MANNISKKELQKINITNYDEIRKSITSGMLAFMSGNYPISKIIGKFTKSPWSHIGILFYIKEIDRVMLLESVEDMGVRFIPFSHYVKEYDGEVVVCSLNNLPNIDLNIHLAKGIDLILRKYDKIELGRIVARIIHGEGKVHDNQAYICSELVAESFKEIYKFKYNKKGFISPQDE